MKFTRIEEKTSKMFTQYEIDENKYRDEVEELKNIFNNPKRTIEDEARADFLLSNLASYTAKEIGTTKFKTIDFVGYHNIELIEVTKEEAEKIEEKLGKHKVLGGF